MSDSFWINLPELWDSEGRVRLRLGALLSRDAFLGLGGTVGGLGWWGGVKHLMGLWGPSGLTGLLGLIVESSEGRSALVEVSVLPFSCRSGEERHFLFCSKQQEPYSVQLFTKQH